MTNVERTEAMKAHIDNSTFRNLPMEFIEYVGRSRIEFWDMAGWPLGGLWADTMPAVCHELADDIFAVSENRSMHEGPGELLEHGIRRLIESRAKGFERARSAYLDGYARDGAFNLILQYANDTACVKLAVTAQLWTRRRSILTEDTYETSFGTGVIQEHPMATFARYLDGLEHIKDIDPELYRRCFDTKHKVVSWRRVGLAFLSPGEWQPRIIDAAKVEG
jgi:hypothetical protein